MPHPETSARIKKLRSVASILASSCEALIAEWEKIPDDSFPHDAAGLPSHEAYNAELTIKAALGSIEELTSNPPIRLMEVSWSFLNARCLHIATELRIADILARGGDDGVSIDALSEEVGIENHKLVRLMRSLASEHIFRQVGLDRFANNTISRAMVDNEPVRSWVALQGLAAFTAADHLPATLVDPVMGPSYEFTATPFNRAFGTTLSFYDWLTRKIPASQATALYKPATSHPQFGASASASVRKGQEEKEEEEEEDLVPRPEETLFNSAMVGSGRVSGDAHVFDYPWQDLGSATVVDVGGGVGGFPMQLYSTYPELKFVVQDQPAMIAEAEQVWREKQPGALEQGRATLMAHDFFEANPVKGAEVYWFRHVLHNWPDKDATVILSKIAASMGASSRLLLAELVIATTVGDDAFPSAPEPLLANYGRGATYSHLVDLLMLNLFNAIERTPAEYRKIIEEAGLRLVKIWPCRSHVSIIECRLP
ncbi:O-methyltransferase [Biscogniauxia marginata]|nr:O-methyltransferase [Biscogniauxia marginata]